jgi:type I restriction enzyme, S subunit
MVGFQQTDIGLIPKEWEVKQLNELTMLMTNGFVGTAKTHYSNNDNAVLYIQGYNVIENGFNYHGIKRVTREFHNKHKKSNLKTNDLLTVQTGEVGLTTIVPSALEGSNCHALIISRFKPNICASFYSYFLNSESGQTLLKTIETGTTMKHINVGDMKYINVPLPPLKEQEAIAEVLSDTDALITKLEQRIAKKRLIKQGAMQTLLTPQDDWEVKKLGDFLEYEQPTKYLVADTKYNDNYDTPVLTAGKTFILGRTNEKTGIYNNLPVIIIDDFTTASKFVEFPFKVKSSAMKILKPKNKYVNMRLVFEIMQRIDFPLGGHKRHWIGEFQHLEIQVPDENEQTCIATILSDMDSEIDILEKKLSKTKELKQGLMQQLLTGKIRLA